MTVIAIIDKIGMAVTNGTPTLPIGAEVSFRYFTADYTVSGGLNAVVDCSVQSNIAANALAAFVTAYNAKFPQSTITAADVRLV